MTRILVVQRRFPDPEALRQHLRMTHRQYVGDVKTLPKTKTAKRRTLGEQLVEIHDVLHEDMDTWPKLAHGTVPHVHLDPSDRKA